MEFRWNFGMIVGSISGRHILSQAIRPFLIPCLLAIALAALLVPAKAQTIPPASAAQRNANVNEAVLNYRRHLSSGEYARAAELIEQARRSGRIPAEDQWQLTLDLAKALRHAGKMDAASKAINQLSGNDALRPEVRVEKAWQQVMAGQGAKVMAMLETLRADSDAEVRCHAGYLLAKVLFEQERIQPSLDACDKAVNDFRKVDFYHNPYDWELFILRRELQKLRAAVRDHHVNHQYGEDYVNYRRGRLAQSRKQHQDAIGFYRLVKGPILSDAAQCYIGACLRDEGMLKEAASHWEAFIRSDELGLYRGEAMLQLGEMYLLNAINRQQLTQAEQWLKRAVEWHDKIAGSTPPVTADSIQAVLKAFPLPPELATRDRFGNFHRRSVSPETIVNRLTSTWYLKDLQLQAVSLHAFALFELGRPETQDRLKTILTLAQANPGFLELGDMPHRLLMDAQSGAFVIPPAAWKALPSSTAIRLHLACYQLRLGQFKSAESLFQEVHQQVRGQTDRMLEWSVAQLGLAHAMFSQGNRNEALNRLAVFDSALSQSPLAPLAMLWAANIHAGQKDGLTDAQDRYARIIKGMPNSDISARAMLALAIASENAGDRQTAVAAVSRLLESSSDARYKSAARTLANRMQGVRIQGVRQRSNDDHAGKVIPFDRHLVVPGHVDFSLDLTQYAAADLVSYEVAYSIRSGCHFKSFHYRTSIDEPLPPPVDKSPLRFLRSPMLVTSY